MDNNQPTTTPPPVAPAPVSPPSPPAEPVAPAPQMPPVENKPSSKIPMIIIIVLLLICLAAGGVIAYRMLTNSNQDNASEKKMAPNEETATPTPFDQDGTPTPAATQSAVQSDIMAAVENKTYNSLASHMTPSVMFEIESSEGLPAATPEEAVEHLDYLNTAAAPWNFDQNDPIILSVKSANPDEYGPLYIGISSNDMMVAFGFDAMDKINLIKVVATYKLLVN